ncbi:MAG: FkbM family methyltransferase [Saprospiraceae bacterium]|nr:FkbM family methyltransferase [Saprospiraceae bacterium]
MEQLAAASKLRRLLARPFRYIFSIGFKKIIYPFTKKGIILKTRTFFNSEMYVVLPAGTDIYLTGGKSHDSEIRLAKFLINHLKIGDTFVDVGAHFGYFSLLSAFLTGSNGRVFSFEASKSTFLLLNKNTQDKANIACMNNAVSDKKEIVKFYEFPVLYSEYNSVDISQFEGEKWLVKYKPQEIQVEAIKLEDFIIDNDLHPKIIKIDVEGAELKVVLGMKRLLEVSDGLFIVMEYLHPDRKNAAHRQAAEIMKNAGYNAYLIEKNGGLIPADNIDDYLQKNELESENIVFKKITNEELRITNEILIHNL